MALALCAGLLVAKRAGAQEPGGRGRVFILMVWDGLRPDSVTARFTPTLYRLEHRGVLFTHQHSQYPTLTMVNAAALATGAPPGENGIYGDSMYLLPALRRMGATNVSHTLGDWITRPVELESSARLAALNSSQAFNGRLVRLDTVAQQLESEDGYLAVVGKRGPAFIFDNRVTTVINGRDSLYQPHKNYLFVSDDLFEPRWERPPSTELAPLKRPADVIARDRFFTHVVINQALPAAREAVLAGRPALIVLWLHNPDLEQHAAGLGTAPALAALSANDDDLALIRQKIDELNLAGVTDLMVVSDHGFATLKLTLDLAGLLVKAGLKKSLTSDDVVVAHDGGSDLVYISHRAFPTLAERRQILQQIVDFAEAQEWCGVIFSEPGPTVGRGRHARHYLGWIDGTFSEAAAGLYNPRRAPDLVISMVEDPDESNRRYTGPALEAFTLGINGQQWVMNHSAPLVLPVEGTLYGDVGPRFTTGMGMHGSAGERELHNFCAVYGPDFRRHYEDFYPTANTDVAPTITAVLGLLPNIGPGGIYPTGRQMREAMVGGGHVGAIHRVTMSTELELQGMKVLSKLDFTEMEGRYYLDDSSARRIPLGSSP